MKSFLLWSVSITFLVFTSLQSTYPQTIVPGGYVSGTWTAAGSPYLIQDNITVQTADTLTIDPGVVVEFQGSYRLIINGILEAVGTATDSISFTALNSWAGINFINAPDSSHIIYCSIIKVTSGMYGGALNCDNSNPVISHSRVSGGSSGKGAIRIENSSNPRISDCAISNPNGYGIVWQSTVSGTISRVTISNCTYSGVYKQYMGDLTLIDCVIKNNTAASTLEGGGVRAVLYGGILSLIGCTISDNSAFGNDGGGIYCEDGTLNLTHCTINGNFAWGASGYPYIGGGGIALNNANASISYCTIFDNIAAPDGGGIAIENSSNLSVDHCTIESNETVAYDYGSGIYVGSGCTAGVTNSIISNNHPDYGIYNSGTLTVGYTDFFNNPVPLGGNIPSGFGVIDTVNANGDSCDVYANIFLDPLFADPANGDYNLTWANWPTPDSTKSPCIDAGDPTSPLDPDGTITDQGAFFFDQTIPVELVSFNAELINDNVILRWITATEINNSGFEIQRKTSDVEWEKIGFVEGHGTTTEIQHYIFTDNDVNPGKYQYKLKQIDYNGAFEYSDIVEVEILFVNEFSLSQNFPNPFNPSTTISWQSPVGSHQTIKVFDVLGNEITTLVDEYKPAGKFEVEFDGSILSSGVYLYRIQAGDFIQTRKMILLK